MEKLPFRERAEPSWVTGVGSLAQNLNDGKEGRS